MPPPPPPEPSNSFRGARHAYLPERARKIMAKRMGQSGLEPNPGPVTPNSEGPPGPNPGLNITQNFQASNHFQQLKDRQPQPPVAPASPQPVTNTAPTPQSPVGSPPQPPATPAEPYDFIMEPGKPASKPLLPLALSGANSTFKRVLLVLGGLFVLLIIFTAVKGLFSGTSNTPLLVGLVQDQQEIIHLTSNANTGTQQQNLSAASQNFAATTNASFVSAQLAIANDLASIKYKLSPAQLNLKVSQQLDTQLTNAAANGTYDQTFRQVMKTQLTNYMNDLNKTYNKTGGKAGQTLLKNDYAQAKLLLTQLGTSGQ